MKTKAVPRHDSRRIIECVDAINRHRENAWAIAGLLELCGIGSPRVKLKAVGHAAELIGEELERVHQWMRKLEEELSR